MHKILRLFAPWVAENHVSNSTRTVKFIPLHLERTEFCENALVKFPRDIEKEIEGALSIFRVSSTIRSTVSFASHREEWSRCRSKHVIAIYGQKLFIYMFHFKEQEEKNFYNLAQK